jgi:hypothetical protein
MSYKYCCDDFEVARRDGTDNEGHEQLIGVEGGKWHIGYDNLAPIEHCPWCGVKLRDPPPYFASDASAEPPR